MACFHGRTLAVIFSFVSVSLLAVYTEDISMQGSSGVKDPVEIARPVFPSNLSAPDVDLADFMLMDAAVGTTPSVCTPGSTCAFQQFRRVHGEFRYYTAITYCYCPEYQQCLEKSVNNKQCFFIYGCRNGSEVSTTTTEAGIRIASDASQLVVSASSMVSQNSATEPGQPVTFKFEGEFPPSSNC